MALTNIFREPRREITETVVGIILFIPVIGLNYWFSNKILEWGSCVEGGPYHPPCAAWWVEFFILAPILTFFTLLIIFGLAILIHTFGEGLCKSLQKGGINLRPKQRY